MNEEALVGARFIAPAKGKAGAMNEGAFVGARFMAPAKAMAGP